jgi:hypothetical protein
LCKVTGTETLPSPFWRDKMHNQIRLSLCEDLVLEGLKELIRSERAYRVRKRRAKIRLALFALLLLLFPAEDALEAAHLWPLPLAEIAGLLSLD